MNSQTWGPSVGQYWSPSSGTMSTATLLHHPKNGPRITSRRLLLRLLRGAVRTLSLGFLALGDLPMQAGPVDGRQAEAGLLKPNLLQQLPPLLGALRLVEVVDKDRKPAQAVDVGLQVLAGHGRCPYPAPPGSGEPVPLATVRAWKGRDAPALAFGRRRQGGGRSFLVSPLATMCGFRSRPPPGHGENPQSRTRINL